MQVPIEVSNRHIHLTEADAKALFGDDYEFTVIKDLSQIGQTALAELVTLEGPKGNLAKVRVLGPWRTQTQVEILASDQYILGIKAPARLSGELDGTPGVTVVGPAGKIELSSGLIVAQRHLHASPEEAASLGLEDGQIIAVKNNGERAATFHNIVVRTHETFRLNLHIDQDEANAAGIRNGEMGDVIV